MFPNSTMSGLHKPLSILEAQVVLIFAVQKLSFAAKGIPSSGPLGTPDGKERILKRLHWHETEKQTYISDHTLKQSGFCFLCLLQCHLLCHSDICIKMLGFLDLIQTLSTKLCWGDSSILKSQRHLHIKTSVVKFTSDFLLQPTIKQQHILWLDILGKLYVR